MTSSRVLVAGATGQLGRVITRKLLDSGVPVRALARNAAKLGEFAPRAEIAAVDMRGWLIPGLACAAFYLALSFPLSELARRLERRLARDQRPHAL